MKNELYSSNTQVHMTSADIKTSSTPADWFTLRQCQLTSLINTDIVDRLIIKEKCRIMGIKYLSKLGELINSGLDKKIITPNGCENNITNIVAVVKELITVVDQLQNTCIEIPEVILDVINTMRSSLDCPNHGNKNIYKYVNASNELDAVRSFIYQYVNMYMKRDHFKYVPKFKDVESVKQKLNDKFGIKPKAKSENS